jgi:CheY-like chemotaxis protein
MGALMARILVVDDEQAMRAAVRLMLEREGHTVVEASDGEMALENLRGALFDAMLLDIQMPGLDGLQTLARVRETDHKLPIIMVTGYGSTDSADQAMALGATHYLSKPFKNHLLMDALSRVLPATAVSIIPLDSAPESASRKSSAFLPVLLTLVIIAGAGAAWHFRPAPKVVAPPVLLRTGQFAIPYQNPSSLFWKGDTLWVLDWFSQSIYVHALKGDDLPIVKTYHLPGSHVIGFALVGDFLYTSDSWTKKIRKHRLDEFLTVLGTYPAPGPGPSALFWDGKYLWCSDVVEGKIYQLEPLERLIKIASYKAPARATAGFYKDAHFAWTADTQTRKLYQHRLDDRLTVIATYSTPAFDEGTEPISSFVWRDSDLWFARDRKSFLYRRSIDQLKRTELTTPIQ